MQYKNLTILIVTPLFPPDIGGPATYSHLVSKELAKRGAFVSVLSFGRVRHYPKVVRHILFFFLVFKKGRGCDIIYAQDPISCGVPARCAAFTLRKKFVIRIAGDYTWEQARQRFGITDSIDEFQKKRYGLRTELLRSIQYFVASSSHLIITPSVYFKNLVSNWVSKKTRVVAIHNGIIFPSDVSFVPYESRERVIVSVGRLVPWKGFKALIEMMKDLPLWRLIIIGDGPEKKELISYTKEKGVESRVTFSGALLWKDTLWAVGSSRIFILNTTFESFSFQTIESLWVGTPTIVTNIGSLPEIVSNDVSGFLVEPNDLDTIKNKIELIENDFAIRDRLITNGRIRAHDFSVEKTTEKLLNELKTL